MTTQMLPPALVSNTPSLNHEDESSTGSVQRVVTDAIKNATANDYRRRLRSANQRFDVSTTAFVGALEKTSERVSSVVESLLPVVKRCAAHLTDTETQLVAIGQGVKMHSVAVTEEQKSIQANLRDTRQVVRDLVSTAKAAVTDVKAASEDCKTNLSFMADFNVKMIMVSMVGLILTLAYSAAEFSVPNPSPAMLERRRALLWLGSTMLAVGLAFHWYMVSLYRTNLITERPRRAPLE